LVCPSPASRYYRLDTSYVEGWDAVLIRIAFAKAALDSGTDLVAVATLLGHQRLETTAIYTKPSLRDLEKAVERLETR
jgi:site-specific recombinase XerD